MVQLGIIADRIMQSHQTIPVRAAGAREPRAAYRPDIDGLRAVAIVSVVIFHAFPSVLRGGFVGVDIFFVISGFLISNILFKGLAAKDFSFTQFYAHRVKRIFPALIAVMAACFAFGWFSLLPDEYAQLGKHMAAGAGFVQNLVLWNEAGYFDHASALKPLMHLWSLAVEEQFYFIYPLLIWAAWRLGANVLMVVLALGLVSFGFNVWEVGRDATATFFFPQARFWELLAGGVLAYVQLFKRQQIAVWLRARFAVAAQSSLASGEKVRSAASLVGLSLIIIAVFAIDEGKAFPGWWAPLPVAGAFLLIMAGPDAWVNRFLLSSRAMVFVGLISYPLYLWHWPILAFAHIQQSATPPLGTRIAAVALSFVLAWGTYRLIERPIRFGRKTWWKTVGLCLGLLLVGTVGYNAYEREGLVFRLKGENRDAFAQLKWEDGDGATPDCRKISGLENLGYCIRSSANSPDVALIGDSHANSLFSGLADEYSKAGKTLINIGGPGCIPLYDTEPIIDGNRSSCLDWTTRALDFAVNTPSVRSIILAGYANANIYGNSLNSPSVKTMKMQFHREPDLEPPQAFAAAFRATLRRLIASGKEVIVVIDWPELGFEPRTCFEALPLRSSFKPRSPCSIDRASVDRRSAVARSIMGQLQHEFPQVKWFDPWPLLCDEKQCTATPEGQVAYRDAHHLSKAGSHYVAKSFARQFIPSEMARMPEAQ